MLYRALSALAVAAVLITAAPSPSAQNVNGPTPDLTSLFGPRGAVRDTNGDGINDAVVARIIVPSAPAREDSLAATNIAARLGFETTSLSFPLVIADRAVPQPASIELPIFIGRSNTILSKLTAAGAIDLQGLAPGQGLIAAVRSPLGGGDGLVIAGADDKGTLAAATHVAARLPRMWNMSGVTLGGLADQVTRVLRSKGLDARAAAVTSIVVDAERRGLAGVNVRVSLPAAHSARALTVFQDLERAHRRGQEPLTLNFADIARTSVEVWADGRLAGKTDVFRSGLNSRTLTPPIDPSELATDSPGDRGRPAEEAAGTRPGKSFDLSNPYSIQGWYADAYNDLIPDRTETSITIGSAADAMSAAHIAARLGLETTGATFPIAKPDDDVREPAREQNPILVGRDNRLVNELEKIGRARLDDLSPGEGVVQIVPKAFGNLTATVVAGADARGTEAASNYLARRVPYVWDNRRGALSYSDVRTELNKFLAAKTGAGQAAQAIGEVQQIVRELTTGDAAAQKPLESFEVKVFLEEASTAFDTFLTSAIRNQLKGVNVSVKSETITAPTPVIDETIEVPWEVDDFRAKVKSDVLPRIKPGSKIDIEARLSESPEFRKQLADDVRAQLTKAGATSPTVRILSAYKQGYLWLTEQVIPELKSKGARALYIKVAEHKPDFSKKYKFYQVPSRWLHELYPVDDIVARDAGIAKDQFHLELVADAKDIYTVEATDAAGKAVYRATFNPKFVEREYLDKFPGWSRVEVTTGWLRATVDGETVVDVRIQTDAERFWDQYQSKILPRIYDHVMKVTDNRPLPDKQPFHRDLDVSVWMSEPDFRIGIDEEIVSSLESLHEDLYFVTLDFFDALGRTTTRRRLAAPGKIFPIIHPEQRGKPGRVHVLYAGNAATKPQLEVRHKTKGIDKPEVIRRDLARIDASPAQALRAVVREDGIKEIELTIEAKDDREAARAADAIDALGSLHAGGLYAQALSFAHVDRVAVAIGQKEIRTRRTVRSTGASAPSNVHSAFAKATADKTHASKPSLPIVTWDHVISPDESEAIVAKLAAHPEVNAYKAGRSYRGRDVSIAEITLPAPGELVSLAKLTALKPTIFITGRQHANEVSSTSHILKLGELLVTDPSYRDILKKVNVVLHPVENPDGAQMAFELQKLTPTHMLHAGRYSALGMDVASQVGLPDPLLPEALVRGRVWQDWLPDIYLNPHGYPSHEWVQQFAGYVPPGFRTYLSTRGWYTNVTGLRDPRYPEHAEAVSAIREAIVREINSNADVRDMNLRSQARYRRWAFGFGPWVYGQEIYKDTAIYYTDLETGEPRGSRRAGASGFGGGGEGGGRFSINQYPQVTFFSGMTESPDETAQGEWLNLATKPGFSFLMANIKYLRDGRYTIERIEESGQRDSTSITLLRVRPVLPGPMKNEASYD